MVIARASEFWMACRRLIWADSRLKNGNYSSLIQLGIDNGQCIVEAVFKIKNESDVAEVLTGSILI